MKICIVRHGATDWNIIKRLQGREDIPLNEEGIEQIESLSLYLEHFKWAAIITSPLRRAKDSAEIINIKVKTDILVEPDFIERDYGDASGMSAEERDSIFPDGNYTGMEPKECLTDRMLKAFHKYIDAFSGKDIIVVSHGAAINALLASLPFSGDGYVKVHLRNASANLIEYSNSSFDMIYYNKISADLLPVILPYS